jgi:hypothetical protein
MQILLNQHSSLSSYVGPSVSPDLCYGKSIYAFLKQSNVLIVVEVPVFPTSRLHDHMTIQTWPIISPLECFCTTMRDYQTTNKLLLKSSMASAQWLCLHAHTQKYVCLWQMLKIATNSANFFNRCQQSKSTFTCTHHEQLTPLANPSLLPQLWLKTAPP